MPSPFPGMDPYLETPELWPDVHHELISQIRSRLNPRLKPNYVARVELRVYISTEDDPGRQALVPDLRIETRARAGVRNGKANRGAALAIDEPIIIPLMDTEIEEAYVAIKDPKTGAIVTIIEVLSPTNKIRGSEGRKSFLQKKNEILATDVNWVEIDLLRAGDPSIVRDSLRESDYRVLVYRGGERRSTRCWPVRLRNRLPVIGIPLKGKDPDVPLDLGAVLQRRLRQRGLRRFNRLLETAEPARARRRREVGQQTSPQQTPAMNFEFAARSPLSALTPQGSPLCSNLAFRRNRSKNRILV